ncbi:hypothetical protein AB0425_17400 [Actinosynnema sp. NPDC051121]
MTAPQLPPQVPELVIDNAAELYALEVAAGIAAASGVAGAVAELWGWAARLWVLRFRGVDKPATDERSWGEYMTDLETRIRTIRVDVGGPLRRWARDALALGARQAVTEILDDGGLPDDVHDQRTGGVRAIDDDPLLRWIADAQATARRPGSGRTPGVRGPDLTTVVASALPDGLPDDVETVLGGVDATARGKLRAAADAASRASGTEFTHVVRDVLAVAQQAVTTAETTTAWSIHRAANAGIQAVAERLRVERLWISERDACPDCLSLSGRVSVGGVFELPKAFGADPAPVWPAPPLRCPPRHPRCRCRTRLWFGSRTTSDLPALLQREAEKAILLGWRRAGDSESRRLAAAEWLLDHGTTATKTDQDRARRAIKNRAFPSTPRRTGTTK